MPGVGLLSRELVVGLLVSLQRSAGRVAVGLGSMRSGVTLVDELGLLLDLFGEGLRLLKCLLEEFDLD